MDQHKHFSLGTVIVSLMLSIMASVATFLALMTWYPHYNGLASETGEGQELAIPEEGRYEGLTSSEARVIDVVQTSTPAVVSIVVTKDIPVIERYFEERSPRSFFEDFFGGGFGGFESPGYRENGTREEEVGGGSGFFVSADGLVVTNKHVVDDPDADYTVVTSDGEKYEAEVLATDPIIDIAVLQVAGEDFPFLAFADSDQVQPGQSAIAIGNALAEFQNSVSVGVISGLSRSIVAGNGFGRGEVLDGVIQTDTAINPGNSGGPLLNLAGEVVGVNVAVAQGVENIGFAIPANIVAEIAASVAEYGEIVRPYLGIRYMIISEALQERNNLSVDRGALIQRGETREDLAVIPGSPADKAGLRENDIIIAVDGEDVTPASPLAQILRAKRVGDTITLRIIRGDQEQDVQVTLEKTPSE